MRSSNRETPSCGLRSGDPGGTVAYLQLLAEILSIVGTALIVWAVVTFLRISDWNSDHFQVALRENSRILAVGLFGLGLDVAGLLLLLVA